MPAKVSQVKLVVCATGDLAIPALQAVVDAGHRVLRIVAEPARRSADSFLPEERQGSALASWARKHEIELRRKSRPGSEEVCRELEELGPDLGLIVAYGRGFPASLLEVAPRGWIEVHHSLLPKYRGLHPIRAVLWKGERQTGATVIRVTEEQDAGPILSQEKVSIGADETFGELAPRIAALGAGLVVPAIAAVCRSKRPKTRKQNEKTASTTPRFDRGHRLAPWWRQAEVVHNRLRALSPEPGLTTRVKGLEVRILQGAPANYLDFPMGEAGSYVGLRAGSMAILCGGGTVFGIDRVQLEDGEVVSASSFARAQNLRVGNVLV